MLQWLAFFDATLLLNMKFSKSFDTPNPIPAEAISNAISQMEHGMLYRYGHTDDISEVSKLEAAFGLYTGHKYVVAVNSCGSAMFIALKAMDIQPGEGVFTNAFTFTAVPSSIVHANANPVYIECNDQYVIDLQHFEEQIIRHPDVRFFILSHMRGHIAELDKIKALCDKNNIRLIEDCAHGLGKRWNVSDTDKDHFVGHHCEIACYSTQSHKMLNSGEGGFIATNDDQLAAYCILAAGSYEGLYKKHLARPMDDSLFENIKFDVPNFSLRMNNLTAAILRPQVELIDERIASYKEKYQSLISLLSSVKHIDIPEPVDSAENVGDSLQFNLIDLDSADITRFISNAKEKGVVIQVFGRNNNARDFRNWQYSFEDMPGCEKTAELISCACDLRLPMSFTLDDIKLIAAIISETMTETITEVNTETAIKSLAG
ncbi:MAG: aminotransferase class I/II-fold pyridoxal phosphate-dependent enzyme [Gammaproteobacteria bacterium]|nr:aminotransferase class I/II-fold pyridoxal phosphate-dependent enzyme [Gammaproteobacteria bacterium]